MFGRMGSHDPKTVAIRRRALTEDTTRLEMILLVHYTRIISQDVNTMPRRSPSGMSSRLSAEVGHSDAILVFNTSSFAWTGMCVINETLIRYSPFAYNSIETQRISHDIHANFVQLHRVYIQFLVLIRDSELTRT